MHTLRWFGGVQHELAHEYITACDFLRELARLYRHLVQFRPGDAIPTHCTAALMRAEGWRLRRARPLLTLVRVRIRAWRRLPLCSSRSHGLVWISAKAVATNGNACPRIIPELRPVALRLGGGGHGAALEDDDWAARSPREDGAADAGRRRISPGTRCRRNRAEGTRPSGAFPAGGLHSRRCRCRWRRMRMTCFARRSRIACRSRSATEGCTAGGSGFAGAADVLSLNKDTMSLLCATGSLASCAADCSGCCDGARGTTSGGTTAGTPLGLGRSKKNACPSRNPSSHWMRSSCARWCSGMWRDLASLCQPARNPQSNGLLSCDTSLSWLRAASMVLSSGIMRLRLTKADLGRCRRAITSRSCINHRLLTLRTAGTCMRVVHVLRVMCIGLTGTGTACRLFVYEQLVDTVWVREALRFSSSGGCASSAQPAQRTDARRRPSLSAPRAGPSLPPKGPWR